MWRWIGTGGSWVVLAATLGCPATGPERSVPPAGFLGAGAALLGPGAEAQPQRYYVDPAVSWSSFDALLIDPVTVWRDPSTAGVSQADAQALANNFHRLLYAALSPRWKMVVAPGRRALRLQVALTQLEGADVVLNLVSSAVPQLRVLTGLEGYATGAPLFTGDAGMAFKVTASATGRLLAEGVDGRVGGKHLSGSWEKWGDVDDAMRYWTEMLRYLLCRKRGGTSCPPPEVERTF